jgi:peptidoglycan/xylan/chitin deacetylase (PgdA/CDA1 family)
LLEAAGVPATVFITSEILTAPGAFWWDRLEHLVLGSSAGADVTVSVGGETMALDVSTAAAREGSLERLQARMRALPPAEIAAVLQQLADAVPRPTGPAPPRRMGEEQVRALARSECVEIGAHTRHHPLLAQLGRDEQVSEIAGSKADLEAAIGAPVRSFAYPFGTADSFSRETESIVAAAGFTLACTTKPRRVTSRTDPFRVPRLAVNDWTGDELTARVTRTLARWWP